MKILILGSTGMLGHTLFYYFSDKEEYQVFSTQRDDIPLVKYFPEKMLENVIPGISADEVDSVRKIINKIKPDVVMNCIGIIKQLKEAKNSILSIQINSLFPHLLAEICSYNNCRLVHISTDCVFSGKYGNYKEEDFADANDLYGRTKYLGEVDYPNAVTLRTSIIGHELNTKVSLIDWFLSQKKEVRGFRKAIYSGFPTVELAEIIEKYVFPNEELHGLYHVSSEPISKYDLLSLVAKTYKKDIAIEPGEDFIIDRSLDSKRFRDITGYKPPSWGYLVIKMYNDYIKKKDIYQQN